MYIETIIFFIVVEEYSFRPVSCCEVSNTFVLQLQVSPHWLGCNQQISAPTAQEVLQDSDDVVRLEMEHGVPAEDEVVANLDVVSDKVVLLKLPVLIAELDSVLSDAVRCYVVPSVVNISP